MQTGELERLKEFGIKKADIVEQGNKIMRGVQLVNNQGQIVDQENFNKALLSLMEERFKGGMAKQATSFKGLMSTIRGELSITLATMAGISNTGEVVVGGLFDRLRNKMQQVVDKLAEWRANGQLQEWSNKVQSALLNFFTVAEKVFGFLVNVGKFIANNWGIIMPVLSGVLAGFMAFNTAIAVTNALTIATRLLNGTMRMNPFGLAALAIAGLVTAGVALYQNLDTIKERARELQSRITEAWEGIKTKTSETWVNIKQTLSEVWSGIIGLLQYTSPAIYVITHWTEIQTKTMEIWTAVKAWLSNLWEQIHTQIQAKWNQIKKFIFDILGDIKTRFDNLVSAAFNWGQNLLQNFIDGIMARWEAFKKTLSDIAQTASDFIGFSSPTKSGPGREADKWAPNLMKMYAEGIEEGIPRLRESFSTFALSMSPAALGPAISNNTTSTVYGGNTFQIYIQGGSTSDQADNLIRELHKRGVRL